MRTTRFAIPLRAAFALLLIGGCRQLVGIDDQPEFHGQNATPTDAGKPDANACAANGGGSDGSACQKTCGGYVFSNAACGACGVMNCCDEAAACMGDVECTDLVACERMCTALDDQCLGLCELSHPNGAPLERALGSCTSTSCESSCIAPKWACLESPVTPPLPPELVPVIFHFNDYATGTPIPNLTLRTCGSTDFECADTLQGPVTTDSQGTTTLQLPYTFNGYTEITGSAYPTSLLFYPRPKSPLTIALPLPDQSTLAALASAITPPDPNRGVVIIPARDCAGVPPAGVTFSMAPDDGATAFYFVKKIPSASATETDATEGFAVGGFANARSLTALTLNAKVVENGLPFPTSVVFTRPGGLSLVEMFAQAP